MLFDIELEEASKPLNQYQCLNDFFTRDLKEGTRPLESSFVSPVDGQIRAINKIESDQITEVKGVTYSIGSLLLDQDAWKNYQGGLLYNFYLSPKDYHQIHFPCDCELESIHYIPGYLWPVNNLTYKNIKNLFAINERVILRCSSPSGKLILVLVGAFNVGSISLAFNDLVTNRLFDREEKQIDLKQSFQLGQKLGQFNMGSSVIMLTDAQFAEQNHLSPVDNPLSIQYGKSLLSISA